MKTKWHLGETKNYERFSFVNSNREINDLNVKKIEKSILEIGIQVPIVVNDNYEIIEGQHRFVALRRNDLVVPYIVSSAANENQISKLQESRKWNAEDFCRSLANKGNIDCQTALEFADRWFYESNKKLSIVKSLELLLDSKSFRILTPLKSGEYKVNTTLAENVFKAVQIMSGHEYATSPYHNKITRALKKLSYELNGLNLKAIERMAKNNYITSYGTDKETYEYIKNKYKSSLKKTKLNGSKISRTVVG